MTTPNNILTVLQQAEEWKTEFDGEITQVQINGEEILKIHNLTKEVSKVGRQVRVLAIVGTSLALACLVIASVILGKKIDNAKNSDLISNSRTHVHKWIVDPNWQQTANMPLSPSKIDD
jgi:hypothetical protein